MDIKPTNHVTSNQPRTRSRSRSRSISRPGNTKTKSKSVHIVRRSISSSSINKLTITSTAIDDETFVPKVKATLDHTLPVDFFKQELISLIHALEICKWHKHKLNIFNLTVNRISGALTNTIYKIEYRDLQHDFSLPPLLLRIYGKNVDSIIDKNQVLQVMIKLNHKNIGPSILGIFTNGTLEQFLEGFITLNKELIRNEVISQVIARRMKELHNKIDLDEKDIRSNLPMSWKLIYKWLNIIETNLLPDYTSNGNKEEDIFFVKFDRFKELINKYKDWLFNKYDVESFSSNYKFCHNDTQYGNLLLHESFDPSEIIIKTSNNDTNTDNIFKTTSNKKDNHLVVIDFEYAGPNFPAYDLVNHFSEWMADYHNLEKSYYLNENNYPNQLQQLNLIKSYVEYDFHFPISNIKTLKRHDIDQFKTSDLVQLEIRKIYNECIYWRPTSLIFWCFWSLIQNGSFKPVVTTNPPESEQGIESTYTITTKENLQADDNVIIDEITSSDDIFNYIKYSQQKSALFIGDLIQLNLIDKTEIKEEYWNIIKYLDTKFVEV